MKMWQKPRVVFQFHHSALSSQTLFLWWIRRGFLECTPGADWRGFPVHLRGAWLLFGILLYLFCLFSGGMSSRGKGADRAKMRDSDEKRRWGGKEYIKGWKGDEKRWGGQRGSERKRMHERQEAPVGSLAEHLSLKRLLLSITVASPLFSIRLFCPSTGGTPKGERAGA